MGSCINIDHIIFGRYIVEMGENWTCTIGFKANVKRRVVPFDTSTMAPKQTPKSEKEYGGYNS
jgi:hypothetical protein